MSPAPLLFAIALTLLSGLVLARELVVPQTTGVQATLLGSLDLEAPATIEAGDLLIVRVETDTPGVSTAELGLEGALRNEQFEGAVVNGAAQFEIDSPITHHAGILVVTARAGNAAASTTVEITPAPAVDPIVPLVGPRTIIADGLDETMVVFTPSDQYGNPMPDGSIVTSTITDVDGAGSVVETDIQAGLGALRLTSGLRTGRMTISATVEEADGPSGVVDIVAGQPGAFEIATSDGKDLLADGFTRHEIRTSELLDLNGNRLPDGVLAIVSIESPEGSSIVRAPVIDGRATTTVAAPRLPGEITISARVSGRQSAPTTLTFAPAVERFEARLDAERRLVIRDVRSRRGGWVPDGTLATILDSTGEPVATTSIDDGQASIELRAGVDPSLVVVLGVRSKVAT